MRKLLPLLVGAALLLALPLAHANFLSLFSASKPPPSTGAKTYYVNSSTGNDANNGTSPATAWQTRTPVNAHVYKAGDSVLFNGGQTFSGPVTLSAAVNYDPTTPPSPSAPLTISSYGTGNATINSSAANVYGLNLNDLHDLVVQNLILTSTANGTTQTAVGLNNNANTTQYSNITFSNLDISGTGGGFDIESLGGDIAHGFTNVTITGVTVHNLAAVTSPGIFFGAWTGTKYNITVATYAFQNVTITNSDISGAGTDGIDFWNITGGLVTNNRIHGNGKVKQGAGGANAAIEFQASTNSVFSFNEVDHHTFPAGATFDGDGINIDQGSSNITAEYNWVHDNAGAGVTVFQSGTVGTLPMSGITVRYNITQNNGTAGASTNVPCEIVLGSSGQIAITGINVYNNTFYNSLGASNVESIVLFNAANITGTVKNNILQGTANPRSVNAPSLNPTTMVFTGNDYFGTTKINWNGTAYTTVAAWNTATGQDASALTSNPALTSAGTGGTTNGYNPTSLTAYNLAGGSPMIGVGQVIASPGSQDYYGNAIPNGSGTGYNVGADGSNPGGPPIPAAPVINSPLTGSTVTTAVATISGSGGTAGDTINITLDAGVTQAATTVSANAWSYNTAALADGSHTVSATESNITGTSVASNSVTFTTSLTIPAPIILQPTGTITTAVATVNGTGTTSGNTITVQIDGAACSPACTTTVAGNLSWTLNTPALANGLHQATAIESNAFSSSAPSNGKNFTTSVPVVTTYTWDPATLPGTMTLDSTQLIATNIATTPLQPQALSTLGHASGQYHFEILTSSSTGGPGSAFGIVQSGHSLALWPGTDTNGTSISYMGVDGPCTVNACIVYNNAVALAIGTAYTPGDQLAFEVDLTAGSFKAQDVTKSTGWSTPVSFSVAGSPNWLVAFAPSDAATNRSGTANFGASTFSAQCSTGYIAWNGTSTACPAAAAIGTGLAAAASVNPSDLPVTHWLTPVRPWAPLNIAPSSYATRANNIASWYLQNTNVDGCLNEALANPYGGTNTDEANGALSHTVGQQLFSGISVSAANTTKGINSVTCSVNLYVSANTVGTFSFTYLAQDMTFYASAAPGNIAGWKSQLNFITPGLPGNTNNWVTYDMKGFWDMHQIGLSAYAGTAPSSGVYATIEGWWTNSPSPSQATRMSDSPWHLYEDQTGFPDSLSVERVGGANILGLIDAGYNGTSAVAMRTDAETAAQTDLLMASADGANPAGGRQSDHNWVDSGQQLTFDIMAQRKATSAPFLAGQFQHAAEMSFNQTAQYALPSSACCNGSLFNPTHSHNDPSLRIGFQDTTGPSDLLYNGTMMDQYMASYIERLKSTVTEQPAPSEIGGYAFATTCGNEWCQAFLAAAGIHVQLATKGATAISNNQYWTALGIDRISKVNWTPTLGPGDGYWATLGGGISFGPTWITTSGGSTWTRLAANPSTCSGAFTTTFATPALTLGKVVWTCTANGSPVFTQNLTVTPDGILSQTTCSGCPSTWGMTFPMMTDNGTLSPNNFGAAAFTTAIGTNAAGLVQTAAANGDQQNFMTVGGGTPTLVQEVTQNNSYGHISAIRAWTGTGSTPDATQTTFIYPRSSSDPLASTVQSHFTITGTNVYANSTLGSAVFSDSINGTYYNGPTAAGGWAQTVNIGGQNTSFNVPCYFVIKVSSGKVSAIETDRNVTAQVPNGASGASYTGANALNLTAHGPRTGL